MNTKKYAGALALLIMLVSIGAALPVSAETTPSQQPASGISGPPRGFGDGRMGMKPAAIGTVSASNGNTLTLTAKNPKDSTVMTYTVDATNAKVMKARAASTVANIAVGDTIMVIGTTNGTTIAATEINDGVPMGRPGMMQGKEKDGQDMQNLPAGNGQPVVAGTVSAISGSSITITNPAGATYTVDATNAKFTKNGTSAATIANVTVGDNIIVQGAVNGSAVTATTVIDHAAGPANAAGQKTAQNHPGFFGAVGGFFKHMFGF